LLPQPDTGAPHSKGIRGLVRRHPLLSFFVIAYTLSQFGVLIEPHTLIPLGPLVAALVVLPLIGGRAALADFWRASIRWRVGVRWYAAAILLPVASAAIALGIAIALGASIDRSELKPWTDVFEVGLTYFVMVGIGEELAWRGVALPRLLTGRSILSAALILGVIHALWHWPLVGGEMTYNQVAPIAISVVAYSVFTAWMCTRTGGSLLLPALSHMAVNTTAYFVFDLVSGSDETLLYWLWAAIWTGAGIAVAVVVSRELPDVTPVVPSPTTASALA